MDVPYISNITPGSQEDAIWLESEEEAKLNEWNTVTFKRNGNTAQLSFSGNTVSTSKTIETVPGEGDKINDINAHVLNVNNEVFIGEYCS